MSKNGSILVSLDPSGKRLSVGALNQAWTDDDSRYA